MLRTLIAIMVLLALPYFSDAQQARIVKGVIIDSRTKEPVAFANIGIEGTYYGAASNSDGYFEFTLPPGFGDASLFASAVGYEAYRMNLSQRDDQPVRILINPTAYDIGEVNVSANSLVLLKAIRDAIDAIPNNYPQTAFSQTAFYKSETTAGAQAVQIDEAMITLSDQSGYKRENPLNEQKNRNYRIDERRRNFTPKTLADGMNQLDNLLKCDIVRSGRNLLDRNFLQDWDLTSDPIERYEGRDVWIINYTLTNPDFGHTGIFNVKTYRGKIYIAKDDHAILRNEMWIRASEPSQHGVSIASDQNAAMAEFEIITSYRKTAGKYLPTFLKMVSRESSRNAASGQTETILSENYLLPLTSELNQPVKLSMRDYYSDTPYRENFWKSFNLAID